MSYQHHSLRFSLEDFFWVMIDGHSIQTVYFVEASSPFHLKVRSKGGNSPAQAADHISKLTVEILCVCVWRGGWVGSSSKTLCCHFVCSMRPILCMHPLNHSGVCVSGTQPH